MEARKGRIRKETKGREREESMSKHFRRKRAMREYCKGIKFSGFPPQTFTSSLNFMNWKSVSICQCHRGSVILFSVDDNLEQPRYYCELDMPKKG